MIIVQHFDIVFKCSPIVHEYLQNFKTHSQAKFQGLDLRIFSDYVLRPWPKNIKIIDLNQKFNYNS